MGKLIISMAITIFSPWEVVLWTPWHYLGDLVSTDVSRVASLDASAFCVAAAEERHGKDGVFQWKNYRKTMEKQWKNHGMGHWDGVMWEVTIGDRFGGSCCPSGGKPKKK